MKKKIKKVVVEEPVVEEQRQAGRPAGVKNNASKRRIVKIEFENFEIVGSGGEFVVKRYDATWKSKNGEYTLKKVHKSTIVPTSKIRFMGSLYACMKYITDCLWDEMCENEDEVIDSFEELLKFSHAIVKKQEDLIEKFGAAFFQFDETSKTLEDWQKSAEKKRRKATKDFVNEPYKELE